MEPFYEQRRWLFLFGKDAIIEWRPSHRLFRKIMRSKEEPNLCSLDLHVEDPYPNSFAILFDPAALDNKIKTRLDDLFRAVDTFWRTAAAPGNYKIA